MTTESISPGELRGLATFLCSIRDDWQPVPVRASIEKLQGYSLVDVAAACTEIARNRSNQYPKMLELKGEEMLRAKKDGKDRPRSQQLPDKYKCDVCGKVRSICQSAATNVGGRDHEFVSAAERNEDRDEMHVDGRRDQAIAAVRAKALDRASRQLGAMFALPADVTANTHPEPEQETA